jgi:hypothetical protein
MVSRPQARASIVRRDARLRCRPGEPSLHNIRTARAFVPGSGIHRVGEVVGLAPAKQDVRKRGKQEASHCVTDSRRISRDTAHSTSGARAREQPIGRGQSPVTEGWHSVGWQRGCRGRGEHTDAEGPPVVIQGACQDAKRHADGQHSRERHQPALVHVARHV